MTMSVFVTMGFWGNKKTSPPLSFFHITRGNLNLEGLKALSQTIAERRISGWNQFVFGEPYLVAETMYKKGQRYEYVAVPKSFESELQGYMLLKGIKFNKVEDTEPIEAESILVSDFSFKSAGDPGSPGGIIGPVSNNKYGGAAVQLLLRGGKKGGLDINSRLISFGDEEEARKIFNMLGGNPKGRFSSKELELATSLRLFRDKNSEQINGTV